MPLYAAMRVATPTTQKNAATALMPRGAVESVKRMAQRKPATSAIAVADGPADEVWVGLAAERGLNCLVDVAEGGWVGGVLQSLQEDDALAGGEIKLAGGIFDNVGANDTVNLLTEWLNGD